MNFAGYFRNHWLKYVTGLQNKLGITIKSTDYMVLLREDEAAGDIDVRITVEEFKNAVVLPPLPHATTHEKDGTDEINIDGGVF